MFIGRPSVLAKIGPRCGFSDRACYLQTFGQLPITGTGAADFPSFRCADVAIPDRTRDIQPAVVEVLPLARPLFPQSVAP